MRKACRTLVSRWAAIICKKRDREPVPARYVRHSQMCPQLDVSDKNDQKTQDMSDKNDEKPQDMSDKK